MGGVSACAREGAAWIRRTTSPPRTTRPKAAKPWPSGLRPPPKSRAGWGPTQMKKSDVALSGVSRAMETVPSAWRSPVALVRSRNGRRCLIPTVDLRREVDRILTARVDAMLAARLPCVRRRDSR